MSESRDVRAYVPYRVKRLALPVLRPYWRAKMRLGFCVETIHLFRDNPAPGDPCNCGKRQWNVR